MPGLRFAGVIEDLQRPALMKIHPRITFVLEKLHEEMKQTVGVLVIALEHFYLTHDLSISLHCGTVMENLL